MVEVLADGSTVKIVATDMHGTQRTLAYTRTLNGRTQRADSGLKLQDISKRRGPAQTRIPTYFIGCAERKAYELVDSVSDIRAAFTKAGMEQPGTVLAAEDMISQAFGTVARKAVKAKQMAAQIFTSGSPTNTMR